MNETYTTSGLYSPSLTLFTINWQKEYPIKEKRLKKSQEKKKIILFVNTTEVPFLTLSLTLLTGNDTNYENENETSLS